MESHFTKKVKQMASKHMKRYLTALVLIEMQTKTTMSYYYISIRMAKIKGKIVSRSNVGKDTEKLDHSYVDSEMKMLRSLWKTVWWCLKILNIHQLQNPAIVLLSIYPGEIKIYFHTKTCTRMLRAF